MATRAAVATGNWGTAGTWFTCNATAESDTGSTTQYTLTTAYAVSATFTPGAIVVKGLMFRVASRALSIGAGTLTVAIDQAGTTVAGSETTVNLSTMNRTDTGANGWIYVQFASPVTLLAATAYGVKAKTSANSLLTLYVVSGNNFHRQIVTTATGAAAAGDKLFVIGPLGGSRAVVTMNNTANTDFGLNATTVPSLLICNNGTLDWGTAAATNYLLVVSGNVVVYDNGVWQMGSVATPVPRGSTATLQFDCTSNGQFNFTLLDGGTFIAQGLSRTAGKTKSWTQMSADAIATATSITVADDTGWLNGDSIYILPSNRTITHGETKTLNALGSTTLSLSAGLTNPHTGTGAVLTEVCLLSKNVTFITTGAFYANLIITAQTYGAIVDCDWVYFNKIGYTPTTLGVTVVAGTIGDYRWDDCSFLHYQVGLYFQNAASDNYHVNNCSIINNGAAGGYPLQNVATSGTNWEWKNSVVNGGTYGVYPSDEGGTLLNLHVGGCSSNAVYFGDTGATLVPGTIDQLYCHSCTAGINFSHNLQNCSTYSNLTANRIGGWSFQVSGATSGISGCTFDTWTFKGSTSGITFGSNMANCLWKNVTGQSESGMTTDYFIRVVISAGLYLYNIKFYNVSLGVGANAQSTAADLNTNTQGLVILHFSKASFGSTNEITHTISPITGSEITVQRHDDTTGDHLTIKPNIGKISLDSSTFRTSGGSEMLTPASASIKLEGGSRIARVASGKQLTVTTYVSRSATYNGNLPRLILKENPALGVLTDTILATFPSPSSDGVWYSLSATTPAATDNGVFEFLVDCDGTAGTIWTSDWSVTTN